MTCNPNVTQRMSGVFMGLAVDLRVKTSDVGIPLLQIEFEAGTTEHNSLINRVMTRMDENSLKSDLVESP